MRKLAFRYRRIKELYNSYRSNVGGELDKKDTNFRLCTVKPVLSGYHIQQNIFLFFQTAGSLLLHESSAETSCMSFLRYFHSAIMHQSFVSPGHSGA